MLYQMEWQQGQGSEANEERGEADKLQIKALPQNEQPQIRGGNL